MRVALVGNGESLLNSEKGSEIDAHDKVIRIKRGHSIALEHPKDMGRKCQIILVSNRFGAKKFEKNSVEWWIFVDSRTSEKALAELKFPKSAIIDVPFCQALVSEYCELRLTYRPQKGQKRHEAYSDDFGHLHPSAGSFGIAYALYFLSPDVLNLYGFDNVISGKHRSSLTRTGHHNRYPDHNWPAEKRLLEKLCDRYDYKLSVCDNVASIKKR